MFFVFNSLFIWTFYKSIIKIFNHKTFMDVNHSLANTNWQAKKTPNQQLDIQSNSKEKSEQKFHRQLRFCEDHITEEDNDQVDPITANKKNGMEIVEVNDTSKQPFNGIGLILCTYIDPETKEEHHQRATGFVVGKDIVITALDALFFKKITTGAKFCQTKKQIIHEYKYPNELAHQIQFYHELMLRKGQPQESGIKVVKYRYNTTFFDSTNPKSELYDFAVLLLESNSMIKNQHILRINFQLNFVDNLGQNLMVTGYSGDSNSKQQLYKQYSEEKQLNLEQMREFEKDNMFYYKTKGGNSGSPILLQIPSSQYEVIGVHKGWKHNHGRCNTFKVIDDLNSNFKSQFLNFKLQPRIENEWKQIQIPAIVDDSDEKDKIKIYLEKAKSKELQHNYHQAINYYENCLQIQIKTLGDQSVEVSSTLNKIGNVYGKKGENEKALETYLKCLQIRRQKFGTQSIEVAQTLKNMGVVYHNKAEYEKALQTYGKCLQIQKQKLGVQSIQVSHTLRKIGNIYDSRGQYEKALDNYEKCYQIQIKISGAESIDVASTLNQIGIVYENRGEYEKALQSYQKCLKIRTLIFGQESIQIADTLKNIANVYENRGEYEKSLENYNKCLEIQIQKMGADSIEVADTLNDIGAVYENKGDYEKALQNYDKCLKIRTQKFGVESIKVGKALLDIGVVYYNKREFDKALQYFGKCLQIRKQKLGVDSIEVAEALIKIGNMYRKMGDYDKAMEIYDQCLKIRTQKLGAESVEVASTLEYIGVVHAKRKDNQKALIEFYKCLKIRTQKFGAESLKVQQTLNNIRIAKKKLRF